MFSSSPRRVLSTGRILTASVVLGACAAALACSSGPTTDNGANPMGNPAPTAATRQQLQGHLTAAMKSAPVVGRMEPGTPMSLVLSLPVKDLSRLTDFVQNVSDPKSSSFRRYINGKQFADRFGASTDDYEKVLAWARANNLAVQPQPSRTNLIVTGTVSDVEPALHIQMQYGSRADGSRFFAPDAEPSLDLDVPVEHISGLENFRPPQRASGSGPNGDLQGNDFRNAYAGGSSLDGSGQVVGIFMQDGFLQSDIDTFRTTLGQPTVTVQSVPAGSAGTEPNQTEGTLDIDMILSMAPAAEVVAFTGDPETILTNMAAHENILQFSSSWFWYSASRATAQIMLQMAAQGQSYFQATGDNGEYSPNSFAQTTDGILDFRQMPYVTLVGGSDLSMNGNGTSYASESAWGGSGGGFEVFDLAYWDINGPDGGSSWQTGLPPYQETIVGSNGASGIYRNVPDVSAQAAGGSIYLGNGWQYWGGTSQATPLWAGFTALANQQAYAAGSSAVGFANPLLYSLAANPSLYAQVFNDIQTGTNGATVGAGYDLATGLGTPTGPLLTALGTPSLPRCGPCEGNGETCSGDETACCQPGEAASLGHCCPTGESWVASANTCEHVCPKGELWNGLACEPIVRCGVKCIGIGLEN